MKLLRVLPLFFAILLLTACNFSLAADVTPPPGYKPPVEAQSTQAPPATSGPLFPLVPPDPAKGGDIYLEKCAPCHGERGLGDGPSASGLSNPVPALGTPDLARKAAPAAWYQLVTDGNMKRFMPPFRSLSDRQRWDVVAYALSLSVPPQSLAQGADLYQANCAACHGETGKGDGPSAAGLSVPDLTDQERMAGKSLNDLHQVITEGAGQAMPAFGGQLSEEERWALAAYTRSLTFAPQTEMNAPLAPVAVLSATNALTSTTPLTSPHALAPVAAPAAVGGFVENASQAPVPAGILVNLHAFDQMQLVYTATATLNEDGSFIFENVEVPAGRGFLATLEHGGIVYGSQLVMAEEDNASIQLPVIVYESTSDTAALSVDRLHYLMELIDEKTLRVVELHIISNTSDQTIAAPEKGQPVVKFSLPPQAANLEIQDGELGQRYIKTEDGFADTAPVRPGQGAYQVMFSYELPYNRKLELARKMALPVQAVVALVPEGGIEIKGEGIQDGGVRDMQGAQYHLYQRDGLAAGDELRMTVSLSQVSGWAAITGGPNANLLIGLGALGLVLIAAGAWLYWRGRPETGQERAAPGAVTAAASLESPEAIMDAILALDDLYQAGELPKEAYLQRRAELKAQLQEATGSAHAD